MFPSNLTSTRPPSARLDPRASLAPFYLSQPNSEQYLISQSFDLQHTPSYTSLTSPPSYYNSKDPECVPTYGINEEVPTMARSLFFYGFFFPPFWIMGALILITPLSPAPSWESRPPEHVEAMLDIIRKAERPWAWRCLFAALLLLITIAAVVVGVVFHAKMRR